MTLREANKLMQRREYKSAKELYLNIIKNEPGLKFLKFNISHIDDKLKQSNCDLVADSQLSRKFSNEVWRDAQYIKSSLNSDINPIQIEKSISELSRQELISRLKKLIGRGDFNKSHELCESLKFNQDAWIKYFKDQYLARYDKYQNYEPSVLVIIPAFNAQNTICESINSILMQTHKNIRIIVVDDASSDETLKVTSEYIKDNISVRLIALVKNVGTYGAINYALMAAGEFDFFAIHGADDWMFANKIENQLRAFDASMHVAGFCGYARITPDKKCLKSNIGDSMGLYPRSTFEEFGFFDNTRFGGDSEYKNRIQTKYGRAKISFISDVLTLAYYSKDNLTAENPDSSEKRIKYAENYKIKHDAMRRKNQFYVTPDIELVENRMPIFCGVATIKGREGALKEAVLSIIDQVDHLFVYQNGYHEIYDFLKSKKITITSSLHTGIDMGDAGKFFHIKNIDDAYYFSIDDDLIYPEDYVENMVCELKLEHDNIIVTHHGRVLKPDARSYYADALKTYQCLKDVAESSFVQFGGTGVMAFRTSKIKPSFDIFKSPNMADVWIGQYAHDRKIPIKVIKHESEWIKYSNKFDTSKTIYNEHVKKHDVQNEIISTMNLSVVHLPAEFINA